MSLASSSINKLLIYLIASILLINSSCSAPLEIEIEEIGVGNEIELTIINNSDHSIPYTAKLLGGFQFSIGLKGTEKTNISSGSLSQVSKELSAHSRERTKIDVSAERFHIKPNNVYEMNLRWGDVHLGKEGVTIADLSLSTDEANQISITTTELTRVRYHPANVEVSAQIKGTNIPVPEIKDTTSSSASVALKLKGMKSGNSDSSFTAPQTKIEVAPSGSATSWGLVMGILLFSILLIVLYYRKRKQV